MSTSLATGIVVAEVHAELEQPLAALTSTSPPPPATAATARLPPEGPSLITKERIGVGASNLVGIIVVGVDACGVLSRSVGQTNRK